MTILSGFPLTGSLVNMTPAASASAISCTTTPIPVTTGCPFCRRYSTDWKAYREAQQRRTASRILASPRHPRKVCIRSDVRDGWLMINSLIPFEFHPKTLIYSVFESFEDNAARE